MVYQNNCLKHFSILRVALLLRDDSNQEVTYSYNSNLNNQEIINNNNNISKNINLNMN